MIDIFLLRKGNNIVEGVDHLLLQPFERYDLNPLHRGGGSCGARTQNHEHPLIADVARVSGPMREPV